MLKKLTDKVYMLPHNPDTDRPVLGYVKGRDRAFLVDAGNSKDHVDLLQNELKKNNLPEPDYVGLTHWHWDHVYGLHAIKAVSIACDLTNRFLGQMARWEWTDTAMQKRLETGEDIAFCDEMIRKEYPNRDEIVVKTADIVFDKELAVDLGGITCKMIRVGGSHSEDSVVFFFPEERIIFVGDAICEDLHHGEPVFYQDKLQKLVSDLEGLDFEICVGGHWEPETKDEVMTYLKGELR